LSHDADASAHLEMTLQGMSGAEIAAQPGWTAPRAEAARKRVARGLAALRAGTNDD
jgi:hypothetical protein